jgi:hypothetical protein
MPPDHTRFFVYRDDQLVSTLDRREEAMSLVKAEAKEHRSARLRILRADVIFDSVAVEENKKLVELLRGQKRDNAIHASIHSSDKEFEKPR